MSKHRFLVVLATSVSCAHPSKSTTAREAADVNAEVASWALDPHWRGVASPLPEASNLTMLRDEVAIDSDGEADHPDLDDDDRDAGDEQIAELKKPGCPTLRGRVKMGIDRDAGTIDIRAAHEAEIGQLAARTAPSTIEHDMPRWSAVEHNAFVLRNVKVTFAIHEGDGDYHLALRDPVHGETMVAEIVDPNCFVNPREAPWFKHLAAARGRANATLKIPKKGKPQNVTASIVGVGFFDTIHGGDSGQKGHAANGVELHPVLAICFGTDCTFDGN